ncbi:AAA family ATPase [Hymenobacter sediminis]|uniref:AAA family ATPase n=1 Tax=Hymenobacter sediminis TaxID=2218621 RepID=UPI0013901E32|nr:AAA family ATPase [Hymenobacter sediminis]
MTDTQTTPSTKSARRKGDDTAGHGLMVKSAPALIASEALLPSAALSQLLAEAKLLAEVPPSISYSTRIRTAAQRLAEASELPPLEPLFGCFWETPGIAILAGDTGVGKSVLAVHLAHLISSSSSELLEQPCHTREKVLYYDFELTDRQFSKRFAHLPFTDELVLGDTNPLSEDVAEFNFQHIEADLDRTGARILILDNITALALKTTADADVSINIMKGLKRLQTERGVSSLVLAHTPKLPSGLPLSLNNLAGSKHLSNFADSVFFIARSAQGNRLRYIKQLKNRTDEEFQGVIVCEMGDEAGYLGFSLVDVGDEADHLDSHNSENPSSAPKASEAAVLAQLPDLLQTPQTASVLEAELARRLGTTTRTIRTRLASLNAGAGYISNQDGVVCALAKASSGREMRYSLAPVMQAA